jgi:hypothetical protein
MSHAVKFRILESFVRKGEQAGERHGPEKAFKFSSVISSTCLIASIGVLKGSAVVAVLDGEGVRGGPFGRRLLVTFWLRFRAEGLVGETAWLLLFLKG